jgi:hypothetical protein
MSVVKFLGSKSPRGRQIGHLSGGLLHEHD